MSDPLSSPATSGIDEAPKAATVRVACRLSYDGTGFHGFASQPNLRTVAGAFCEALGTLTGEEVPLVCAGRTDVGVHGSGQVVHVDLDSAMLHKRFHASGSDHEPIPNLARALTSRLSPDVVVWSARVVPQSFDARHSAQWRRYHYRIDLPGAGEPWRRQMAWQVGEQLDLPRLQQGAEALLGEHDFSAYCRPPKDRPCADLTRRLNHASWEFVDPGRLRFTIEANAFCHQMVRSIVGQLAAIGSGRVDVHEVAAALERRTRDHMPPVAPAHGLCLVAVGYPEEFPYLSKGHEFGAETRL